MRILYIDCGMGAAGDMLTAALLELVPDAGQSLARLNALGVPGAEYRAASVVRHGIKGTRVQVLVNGEEEGAAPHDSSGHRHGSTSMTDIRRIFEGLNMPEETKAEALSVYRVIAEAESEVHGLPVAEVHFHEVGATDAVADVAAVATLMRELSPGLVAASPVHVGSGSVRCAHGVLPVPAPATEIILRGVPVYGGEIKGELCTPTGAALLRRYASSFGPMPPMRLEKTGCGMGAKDFAERANCLRVMIGEAPDAD